MKTGKLEIKLMVATHRNLNLNCIYHSQVNLLVRENVTQTEANEITRTFIALNQFDSKALEPRWYPDDGFNTLYFDDDRGFYEVITREQHQRVFAEVFGKTQ